MRPPQSLVVPSLATLANPHGDANFLCHHATRELTAVCPETRSPDFYLLDIWYLPGDTLVELKSLRNYVTGFRDVEIYHEPLLNTIFDAFAEAVRPTWMRIRLTTNPRGGITSTYRREIGQLPPELQVSEVRFE